MRVKQVYHAYSSVLSAVQQFCSSRSMCPIMPAFSTSKFEFSPEKCVYIGQRDGPTLLLPTSSSFHKQLACHYVGDVFCIAPCYRREGDAIESDQSRLEVFAQIEVELAYGSFDKAIEVARALLSFVAGTFPKELLCVDENIFDQCDVLDVAQCEKPPGTGGEFNQWSIEISRAAKRPVWVLHTPQTPRPMLNKDYCVSGLSTGFDLLLPNGFGEVLSGGERNEKETIEFLGNEYFDGDVCPSSGFGIGLERLLRFLLEEYDITSLVLPGHGYGRMSSARQKKRLY